MPDEIAKTLNERGRTHGNFGRNAYVSQGIKNLVKQGWPESECKLTDQGLLGPTLIQREALDFIAGKLGRINQNPHEIDHWRDIAGYAMLVVRDMEKNEASATDTIHAAYGRPSHGN